MRYLKSSHLMVLFSCFAFLLSHLVFSEETKQSKTPQKTEKAKKLYRVIDKNGNVSFSDTPSPGAKEIVLEEVPSMNLTPPKIDFEDVNERSNTRDLSEKGRYTTIGFLDLEQNGVIRNNGGVATLTASLTPALASRHFLKFYIDGKLIGQQQKELSITAENIEYGPHTASLIVVSVNGAKVQQSETVKFSLLHIVRKRSGGAGGAANNILNPHVFETNLPQHPKVPSYESMKQTDKTDK
jgi:hypothetical protein